MKQIPDALAARLGGEVTTLCLCWQLTRKDGAIFGLTDHDRSLEIDDVTFDPGLGVEAGSFTQSESLKPGRGAAGGVLSNNFIVEDDLLEGLWDMCAVNVYRVDWERPDLGKVFIWSGYLSEISYTPAGSFEAELISLKSDLERPIGRVMQKQCDASLGDARCGVSADGRTCDQRFETCRDVFANTENFRGFPHMPGTDFVLSGPSSNRNDGGRR